VGENGKCGDTVLGNSKNKYYSTLQLEYHVLLYQSKIIFNFKNRFTMKSFIKFSVLLLLLGASSGIFAQNSKEKIISQWKTEDKSVLEFHQTSTGFVLKQISAGKEADKKYDTMVIGKDITGSNKNFSGTVMDSSDKKEYKAKWTLSDDEKTLILNVKWGILSFKETWVRVN
jgi:uncharacterized protein (DUF2147 family)